jgi:cytochrome c
MKNLTITKGNKMKFNFFACVLLAASSAFFINTSIAADFDADAAKSLAKRNDCFKCHAVDKAKKGPSYKSIAAKYKGKPEAEAKLIKQITTAPKVKLDDGTEEEHKIIDTKDQKEMKNLVSWILSL